jgi:hypothetical protein
MFTMRNGVLLCMALAIVAGSFTDVANAIYGPYLKAAAVAFTGLAGLLMHPPTLGGDPPAPKASPAVGPTTGNPA